MHWGYAGSYFQQSPTVDIQNALFPMQRMQECDAFFCNAIGYWQSEISPPSLRQVAVDAFSHGVLCFLTGIFDAFFLGGICCPKGETSKNISQMQVLHF